MTKLWKVSRTDRIGYDDYDSMIVAADTQLEARTYHPNGWANARMIGGYWRWFAKLADGSEINYDTWGWGEIDELAVEYLGTTDRDIKGVILASFNAG